MKTRIRGHEMARWVQGWSRGIGHKFQYGTFLQNGKPRKAIICEKCRTAIPYDQRSYCFILRFDSPRKLQLRLCDVLKKRTCSRLQIDRSIHQDDSRRVVNFVHGIRPSPEYFDLDVKITRTWIEFMSLPIGHRVFGGLLEISPLPKIHFPPPRGT